MRQSAVARSSTVGPTGGSSVGPMPVAAAGIDVPDDVRGHDIGRRVSEPPPECSCRSARVRTGRTSQSAGIVKVHPRCADTACVFDCIGRPRERSPPVTLRFDAALGDGASVAVGVGFGVGLGPGPATIPPLPGRRLIPTIATTTTAAAAIASFQTLFISLNLRADHQVDAGRSRGLGRARRPGRGPGAR